MQTVSEKQQLVVKRNAKWQVLKREKKKINSEKTPLKNFKKIFTDKNISIKKY